MDTSSLKGILVIRHLIPWSKSWIMRVGYLDFFAEIDDIFTFLRKWRSELPEDLRSMQRALIDWKEGRKNVHVEQSATLLRFLQYAVWAFREDIRFVKKGTLISRAITNDNDRVLCRSAEELLKLDGGTSQWASAQYLYSSLFAPERARKIDSPPAMLQLTYDAVDHWLELRKKGQCWRPRYDGTLIKQAVAIVEMLQARETLWRPQHSEDYCLARVLELISKAEGEKLFFSAAAHETNRFLEMERVIGEADSGQEISSIDHRPIQAGEVRQLIGGREIKVKYPLEVAKSWPQYWRFVDFLRSDILGATR